MQTNFTPRRSSPIRQHRRKPRRSCAPACIAASAPRPARPTCCSATSSIRPRGRIYLIKDMLENDRPATRGGGQAHRPLPLLPLLHDDLPVGRALHASRRSRPRAYRGDLYAAAARPADARRCWRACCPIRRGSASRCGRRRWLGKPFAPLLERCSASKPLAAMLRPRAAPRCRRRRRPTAGTVYPRRRRSGAARVALLAGCAKPVLAPVDQRGHDPPAHPPRRRGRACRRARAAAARSSITWAARTRRCAPGARQHRRLDARDRRARGSTPSSSPPRAAARRSRTTASCCATDPAYAEKAARVSALARDITEYLRDAATRAAPRRAPALTVAYHSACSLQHGQQITRRAEGAAVAARASS